MYKNILFKSTDGHEIISFSNFKLSYDSDYKRVVYQVTIDFDFFKANTFLDGEEFDFINMKQSLKKLYLKEWESFIFNPIGEQFNMKFTLDNEEKIKIHSVLYNLMFTGKLEIDFFLNRKILPELIKNIDDIFGD